MKPASLLAAARELMARPDATTLGVWPRTSALLARQALEQAIRLRWLAEPQTAALAACSMRSQLTCLPYYVAPAAAGQIAHAWAALSSACHHHPYELAPTAAELTSWFDDVARLIPLIEPAGNGAARSAVCPGGLE